MKLCSYRPLPSTIVNSKGINERFKTLFDAVCHLAGGGSGGIQSIVPGTNISVDNTDPANPIVSSAGGGIDSVVAGTGISINITDPANPIISTSGVTIPISSLTDAAANNTVNLGAFRQQWNPSGVGNPLGSLSMTHTITTVANNHKNIYINMAGAHAASSVGTWGLWLENNHTGTSSINRGAFISAVGATTNTGAEIFGTQIGVRGGAVTTGIAGWFDRGRIESGSPTFNNGRIDFKGFTSGTYQLECNNTATTLEALGQALNTPSLRFTSGATTASIGVGAMNTLNGAALYVNNVRVFTVTSQGGVNIGRSYAATDANTDGASIEGRVSIGRQVAVSTLDVAGSLSLPYRKVLADADVITATDYVLSLDNTANTWEIFLPDAATCLGRIYVIKKFDVNSTSKIIISSLGGSVQDPTTGAFAASFQTPDPWALTTFANKFQSNGTNWEAIM